MEENVSMLTEPGLISNKQAPLAALKDGVIFPKVEMVLTFGRQKSINAVVEGYTNNKQVVFVSQTAPVNDPNTNQIYKVGVLCNIERTLKVNDEINVLIRGITRVKILSIDTTGDFYKCEYEEIVSTVRLGEELDVLAKAVMSQFKRAVSMGKGVEFMSFMKLMSGVSAEEMGDQVMSLLDISTAEKQKLLEITHVNTRLEKVLSCLNKEINILDIERNIYSKTQKKFDKNMKENILREKLKTIQKELGEGSDEEQEVREFKQKVAKLKMSKELKKKVIKELNRFDKLSVHNPEYSYIRTWIETIIELPWGIRSEGGVSIKEAEKVLNHDHYGLEEIKERIIEYLAVLKLKQRYKREGEVKMPTIICFVGPPGVGKTSLGRSIARALKRKFVKMSLGGIRDEAEIRGHRRTYVGALPGRIVQGIKDAGTMNPVFMLDEIDKLDSDYRGDPSAALLEALDPEQNKDYVDHYLDLPFDLSEVIFITTANVLDTIPPALLDRLEVVEFSGYTLDEKFAIAKSYLLEKTRKVNALLPKQIIIDSAAIKDLISRYTREAGVRNLERQLSKVMRKAAKKIAANEVKLVKVTKKSLDEYLGPYIFTETLIEKKPSFYGLATGLAWTQAGGDIIFIEVAVMPGSGNILLTGKLGEVMQESAKAAWSYVRSRWEQLGLKKDFYKSIDVHVHVPEGAVPKDGPSAGDTITTALVSALTKRPVKTTLGMTGEVTLRGRVLEIGGVKEKVIAGHRAGLLEIVLPKDNQKDLIKIPKETLKEIKFHFVENMDQVLKIALLPPKKLTD